MSVTGKEKKIKTFREKMEMHSSTKAADASSSSSEQLNSEQRYINSWIYYTSQINSTEWETWKISSYQTSKWPRTQQANELDNIIKGEK